MQLGAVGLGFELVWESGRENVGKGGLAGVSPFESHGFDSGRGLGITVGTSGTEEMHRCCEEVEVRNVG